MRKNKPSLTASLLKLASSLGLAFAVATACAAPEDLVVPDGFTLDVLPIEVPNARQMALSPAGTLLIGSQRKGSVYAVPDALTSAAPQVIELFANLTMPSGITVHDGDLYIGAREQVIRVAQIDANLKPNPPHQVITDSLPDKSHHGWKYLKFGPDNMLYVPVGAPCNVCLSDDPRFASILRMDPRTGATSIWARGIRNTVGFAWHPTTGQMWFTDNGRDMLGDDVPAEEINVVTAPDQHFGFPFVHQGDIRDPEFGDNPAGAGIEFTSPRVKIQAHSAALGATFYTGTQFPAPFHGALFVAEHGSWNRSEKVGYRVSVIRFNEDGSTEYSPFISGWLQGQSAWGRPNDVLATPDGALLVSDDQKGVIYRVRYQ